MADDAPDVEPLILPLTRPPMYFGVDISVFVVNGLIGVVLFIATSNFLSPLVVLPLHLIGVYLCQRDLHIVRVTMVLAAMKRAMRNQAFWKSRSYSP